MRFSLRLNNDLPVQTYIALAQQAEAVGFDQFWISNDLFLRSALPILAAVAQKTERMEIGSCIFNPYTINPAEIAMAAATLDELSGNRFNLGLAAGAADFLQWIGLEQARPLSAMRESIAAIRDLLSGEMADLDGQFLTWGPDAFLRFNAPRVTPIYVGAMGPKMLSLAGEIGDGVLPLLFPPEHYFGVKPFIERGMALSNLGQDMSTYRSAVLDSTESGRSASRPFDFVACIWVSLSDDADAARRVLAEKIAYYGPSLSPLIMERLEVTSEDFDPIKAAMAAREVERAVELVDERMLRIGVIGQAKDVIERLEPLAEAGVGHLSFGPPLGPDLGTALALLGDVIHHFR